MQNLMKLTKKELVDIILDLQLQIGAYVVELEKAEKVGKKAKIMVAPLPETPKLGVHCHVVSCKETTDVRGFFCCGNHGCDHS